MNCKPMEHTWLAIQKIGEDERMDKVTDMPIAQAKRLSDLMIDTDLEVVAEQAQKDLRLHWERPVSWRSQVPHVWIE